MGKGSYLPRLTAAAACAVALVVPGCASPSESGNESEEVRTGTIASAVSVPASDPWYTPPANWQSTAPGTILKTRSVNAYGLAVYAKQSLVRSTDAKGNPISVATTLMVPMGIWLGYRPLVSYQPAIDSLGDQCQPSYELQTQTLTEAPIFVGLLNQGWAVTITDFEGPRHSWSSSLVAGRATLDGIRAALKMSVTNWNGSTANTKVAMMGYSGGGYATAMAAELAPTYAPEIQLKGAAFGGAGDLRSAGMTMDGGPFAGLFLGGIVGQSREYPEMLPLFSANGRALAAQLGDLCGDEMQTAFANHRVNEMTTDPDPFNNPTVLAVLNGQRLGYTKPKVPMLMYHSVWDQIVPYNDAVALKGRYCGLGTSVDIDTYYITEHITTAISAAPNAISWIGSRFIGLSPTNNCP